MGPTNSNLAALIGSRICHDLISPIGAINNGLELLNMSGSAEGPELDLIGQSAGNASARIRFFRIAFGAAGDQMVGRAEIASVLHDLHAGSRLQITWGPAEPQPRSAVRLAFLGIMCLETGMPYGGRIDISESDGQWQLQGVADKFNVDPDLWSILAASDLPQHLQPAHVQFALMPRIALDEGRRVVSHADEEMLRISF